MIFTLVTVLQSINLFIKKLLCFHIYEYQSMQLEYLRLEPKCKHEYATE